ncbi:MAG: DHA2 family efflux MFS transporter permease subunit [Alphaproteobacteria bacterium]
MTQTSVVSEERRLGIRELLAFTGMALGMFLAVLNIQIVGSSFDQIKAGLAAGSEEVSWVLTSALMAEVIMIPMSGWLCRLMSTRWLFTGCLLGFGLASIGCALATSIEQMIIFRAAQGFMGGGLAPMIWAAIYVSFPRRYQNYLLAIVSLLGTSAVALGPSLGGWISEEMSWPWLFYFSVPFAALSAAMVFFFVDFDMPDWSIFEDIDVLGILLMATFFMCLLIVLEEGRRQDWLESRLIVVLATISAISGLLFIWRELTCSNPLIDLRVFGYLNFSVGSFYVAVFGAGMYVPLYLLPLFLSRIIGLNTWQIGSMLVVLGVTMMVSGFFMPLLMRTFSLRTIAIVGFSMMSLGTWYQAQLNFNTGFMELLLPQVLRGAATQMCFLSMVGLAVGSLPEQQVKAGAALFQLTMRLGAAVCVTIANNYLFIRTRHHYHDIRESIVIGDPVANETLGLLEASGPRMLGESPWALMASLQRYAAIGEREAMILAFNEVTTVVALCIAVALIFMPLVRNIRRA